MNGPRALLIDTETTPMTLASWTLWPRTPLKHETIQHDVSLICGCWKWLGKGPVESVAVDPRNPRNDKAVVQALMMQLEQADYVVGQNLDRFDLPIINARAIFHGLRPRPPVPTVDTLKLARKHFGFSCNKLDYLGAFLGVGRKLPTSFNLWLDVMAGDAKALQRMVTYCKNDVRLLESVYRKLRPWSGGHPNANLWGKGNCCPVCGSSSLQKRGYTASRVALRARYQCTACGAWGSGAQVARSTVR